MIQNSRTTNVLLTSHRNPATVERIRQLAVREGRSCVAMAERLIKTAFDSYQSSHQNINSEQVVSKTTNLPDTNITQPGHPGNGIREIHSNDSNK